MMINNKWIPLLVLAASLSGCQLNQQDSAPEAVSSTSEALSCSSVKPAQPYYLRRAIHAKALLTALRAGVVAQGLPSATAQPNLTYVNDRLATFLADSNALTYVSRSAANVLGDKSLLDDLVFDPSGWGQIPNVGTVYEESGGQVTMEAENFHVNTARGGHTWNVATNGLASGGNTVVASPNSGGAIDTGYLTGSPRLDFEVNFAKKGTYFVWIRGSAATGNDDSCHVGIDGTGPSTSDRISGFTSSLGWSKGTLDGISASVTVGTVGAHTIHVWMREDGFVLDKVLLTTSATFTPSGSGPAESAKSAF